MIVLVDTCVIIDALQKREPFFAAAQELFLAVANREVEGCITAKSVADIYYLVHKCTHSDTASREILAKLLTLFAVLDTRAEDCQRALFSEIKDYEDAIMVETAKRAEVDCIITRNLKDYAKASIKIMTPDDFVSFMIKVARRCGDESKNT